MRILRELRTSHVFSVKAVPEGRKMLARGVSPCCSTHLGLTLAGCRGLDKRGESAKQGGFGC